MRGWWYQQRKEEYHPSWYTVHKTVWSNRLQLRRINKNRLHTLLTLHFIFKREREGEREEHTHTTNLLKYTVRSIINLTSRSSPSHHHRVPPKALFSFFVIVNKVFIVGKQTTYMTKQQNASCTKTTSTYWTIIESQSVRLN